MTMKLYHSTSRRSAEQIMGDGFKDADFYGIASGVFFADRPLLAHDMVAASAETTIEVISGLSPSDLDRFQLIEDGRPVDAYREWIIPAEIANRMPRRIMSEAEL